jgi:hypothetical protein
MGKIITINLKFDDKLNTLVFNHKIIISAFKNKYLNNYFKLIFSYCCSDKTDYTLKQSFWYFP